MLIYEQKQHYLGLSQSDLDQQYLSLSGINRYPRPFAGVPGSASAPTFTCYGRNRDGLYFPEPGVVGVTTEGRLRTSFEKNLWKTWSRFNHWIALEIPDLLNEDYTQTLQAKSGSVALVEDVTETYTNDQGSTVSAGQLARLSGSGNLILADATSTANFAHGILSQDAPDGDSVSLRFSGKHIQNDWMAAAGTTTLTEGSLYYLSDTPGGISLTPGTETQVIGLAFSPTGLFLRL